MPVLILFFFKLIQFNALLNKEMCASSYLEIPYVRRKDSQVDKTLNAFKTTLSLNSECKPRPGVF